jgi:hypothetical protein
MNRKDTIERKMAGIQKVETIIPDIITRCLKKQKMGNDWGSKLISWKTKQLTPRFFLTGLQHSKEYLNYDQI